MPRGPEDIESYLIKMELPYESPKAGFWVVRGAPGIESFVVSVGGPVVVFRIKVMEVPPANREELFRTLLELNATDMIHGSYGLEGPNVVLVDCLELENLDFNEFQATFDDMTMALANHYQRLAKFRAAA
ncbi:MAG TPA: YbjN domain-containing protein [Polyangia bacterium]|nr:YbjN domain-containing protein [Polyangia bacterium]